MHQISIFDIPQIEAPIAPSVVQPVVMPVVDMDMLRKYKKKFNFFATPETIADEMVEVIDGLGRDALILEPSAGLGALIKAIEKMLRFATQRIDFCEVQEEFAAVLSGYNRVGSDFLQYRPGPIYDAVVMNPPYKERLAEKHVNHAWECIKPGGWISALVGKSAALWIDEEFDGHIFTRETIKKGFKETSVDTVHFTINKPLWA